MVSIELPKDKHSSCYSCSARLYLHTQNTCHTVGGKFFLGRMYRGKVFFIKWKLAWLIWYVFLKFNLEQIYFV